MVSQTTKTVFFYAYMLLILSLILSSGGYVIYKIYVDQVHVCTTNPLVYASNKWVRDYGNELIGSGRFIDSNGNSFIVEFNSSTATIKDATAPSGTPLIIETINISKLIN